jgi:hypothetical protein
MFQMETGDLGLLGQLAVSLVEVELKPEHETVTILLRYMEVLLALAQELIVNLAALQHALPVS